MGTLRQRKHSQAEIAAKLAQADDLARQGKLQSEIAEILGVSVMTLHRWRKARPAVEPAPAVAHNAGRSCGVVHDQRSRVADLELENARLRQLLTDLLLETMKLEEIAGASPSETVRGFRRSFRAHRLSLAEAIAKSGGPGRMSRTRPAVLLYRGETRGIAAARRPRASLSTK